MNFILFGILRLTNTSISWENELNILKKAVGFKGICSDGMDFGFYKVSDFSNCTCGTSVSATSPPVITSELPSTTTQTNQINRKRRGHYELGRARRNVEGEFSLCDEE